MHKYPCHLLGLLLSFTLFIFLLYLPSGNVGHASARLNALPEEERLPPVDGKSSGKAKGHNPPEVMIGHDLRESLVGRPGGQTTPDHGVDVDEYMPFQSGNRLVVPPVAPGLSIEENYPRLDGAIAVLPLYAAAAQAIYKGLDGRSIYNYVQCANTRDAYQNLVDGRVDIFFGAPPSAGQLAYAREKGVELKITPLGREAFVFFTNHKNPVRNITLDQIRAIYTRRITNWKELGGADERILAFQRPEGSGSQTAMLGMVMKDEKMAASLQEEFHLGMGAIINGVAVYRNRENAIGYSFRWFATVLHASPQISLLAINGVEPNVKNIRGGAYPLTGDIAAVTARPLSPESKKLLKWLQGPKGQALLEQVGYVGLGK